MDEDSHGEPAIEKLLTKSRCHCEREIGEQLHRGLRQDPFRDGLKRAPGFDGYSPHAPQVHPLKSRDRRGADNRGNKNSGSVMDRQTKLGGSETVHPCTPCHHRDGKPLKGNGRGIKGKPLCRADVWHRQQFLHAHTPAPRQNQAKHEKDEPDVPGHPRIRTLSTSVAQVTKVPRSRSVFDYLTCLKLEELRLPSMSWVCANPINLRVSRGKIDEGVPVIYEKAITPSTLRAFCSESWKRWQVVRLRWVATCHHGFPIWNEGVSGVWRLDRAKTQSRHTQRRFLTSVTLRRRVIRRPNE